MIDSFLIVCHKIHNLRRNDTSELFITIFAQFYNMVILMHSRIRINLKIIAISDLKKQGIIYLFIVHNKGCENNVTNLLKNLLVFLIYLF